MAGAVSSEEPKTLVLAVAPESTYRSYEVEHREDHRPGLCYRSSYGDFRRLEIEYKN